MIKVRNLKKNYGSFAALHGISFTVERGHVYGFLGPNGAGKSTTMNIITGCLAATDGTVTINGHDIFKEPIEAKRSIGYLPEQPPLYLDMKVTEYLDFVGRAKGLRGAELFDQIDEVTELTGLSQVKSRLIKNLSKGYKQRVGIAQAMLGNPEVIILDEPTVGLDPIQIIEIRDLIKSLSQTHTVILSSHIMQEISAVCDRIMIISSGRLVASDTIDGLVEKYCTKVTLEIVCKSTAARIEEVLSGVSDVLERSFEQPADNICRAVLVYNTAKDIREAVWKKLTAVGVCVLEFTPHVMTLEDIFISLTSTPHDETTHEDTPHADEPRNGGKKKAAFVVDDGDGDDDDGKNDDGTDYKPLFS